MEALVEDRGLPPATDVIKDFLANADERLFKKHVENSIDGPQLDWCIVNSWVAFNYLRQGLLTINAAKSDCKDVMDEKGVSKRICASDVFGILQCFFSTGGYVGGLVSQCAVSNAQANCAGAIIGWLGSITELFQATLSMPQTCDPSNFMSRDRPLDTIVEQDKPSDRRLSDKDISDIYNSTLAAARRLGNHATVLDISAKAWCEIEINSALAYTTQSGVALAAAARNCRDTGDEDRSVACAVDIGAVIWAISDIVAFVGGAASLCAATVNQAGLCAGDVGTLGNALGGLVSASAAFKNVCRIKRDPPTIVEPIDRRLSQDADSEAAATLI